MAQQSLNVVSSAQKHSGQYSSGIKSKYKFESKYGLRSNLTAPKPGMCCAVYKSSCARAEEILSDGSCTSPYKLCSILIIYVLQDDHTIYGEVLHF